MFFYIPKTTKGTTFVNKLKHFLANENSLTIESITVKEDDYLVDYYNINVELKNDWSIIGSINHVDQLVYNLKYDGSLQKYLKSTKCDSCSTKRNRNKTFIIQHKLNEEILQVGTSCLGKYMGYGKDFWEMYSDLISYSESYKESEEYEAYKTARQVFDLEEVLYHAINIISKNGFVSRSRSWEAGGYSTAGLVKNLFTFEKDSFEANDFSNQSTKDKVKMVIDFLKNDFVAEQDNDFHYNIQTVFERVVDKNYVTDSELGFVVYFPVFFDTIMKKRIVQKENNSQWVGEIKEKMEKELTFVKSSGYDGVYGYVNFYNFIDDKENVFIWKTTKNVSFIVTSKYNIKFTIKEHTDFRGIKQTIITRAKVL